MTSCAWLFCVQVTGQTLYWTQSDCIIYLGLDQPQVGRTTLLLTDLEITKEGKALAGCGASIPIMEVRLTSSSFSLFLASVPLAGTWSAVQTLVHKSI